MSNKSNQTPSHWDYDDMIGKDQVKKFSQTDGCWLDCKYIENEIDLNVKFNFLVTSVARLSLTGSFSLQRSLVPISNHPFDLKYKEKEVVEQWQWYCLFVVSRLECNVVGSNPTIAGMINGN